MQKSTELTHDMRVVEYLGSYVNYAGIKLLHLVCYKGAQTGKPQPDFSLATRLVLQRVFCAIPHSQNLVMAKGVELCSYENWGSRADFAEACQVSRASFYRALRELEAERILVDDAIRLERLGKVFHQDVYTVSLMRPSADHDLLRAAYGCDRKVWAKAPMLLVLRALPFFTVLNKKTGVYQVTCTNPQLAEATGLSLRSVWTQVDHMVQQGILTRTQRGFHDPRRAENPGVPSKYILAPKRMLEAIYGQATIAALSNL